MTLPTVSPYFVTPFLTQTNPLDILDAGSQKDISLFTNLNTSSWVSDFEWRHGNNLLSDVGRSSFERQAFSEESRFIQETIVPETFTTKQPEWSALASLSDAAWAAGVFSLLFLKIPITTGFLALGRYLFGTSTQTKQPEHKSSKTISALEKYALSSQHQSSLRKKYAHLYDATLIRKPDQSVQFHNATLFQRKGIHVLHLKGDHFEMAYQHGRLMRETIGDGTLKLVSEKIPRVFRSILGENSRFYGSVSILLNGFVHREMLKHTPAHYLEELFALSEGSGFPYYRTLAALTAQEVMHILARFAIQKVKVEAAQCASCCTSFSAWNDYSQSGGMIVARNFDNPLNGYFDRYPTVIYFEPSDGGQKYVSITSAGVHTAGITSYNDSGIYLALHTIPSRETSPSGTSALHMATEVIRQARNFDEAVEIFSRFRSPVGWAFHLVSAKEKRAATIELTNQKMSVHETNENSHVLTNHFNHSEMHDRIMYVNASVDNDTQARYLRTRHLLDENRNKLDARKAMAILADQTDHFLGKIRGLENTIGVHTTVGSVVMLPDESKFYVANGMAPVQHNEFIEFPTPDKFDPVEFSRNSFDVIENSQWKKNHTEMYEAVQHFIEAKKAYEFDKDNKAAFALLKKTVEKDDSNSSYFFNLAIIALKTGDTPTAIASLESILQIGHPQQNVFLAHYYLGRIYAQQRKYHRMALRHFLTIMDHCDACSKMKSATAKAIDAIRQGHDYPLKPEKIGLMMQQSDVENY